MHERYFGKGLALAFDNRGTDKEGHRWRYTGWFGETISYIKVSDKAADFFDSIIDNMCWDVVAELCAYCSRFPR